VSHGFSCFPILLNAEDYGVPQSRLRVFILAYSGKYFKYPQLAQNKLLQKLESLRKSPPTLWDAIKDLPSLSASTVANKPGLESKTVGFSYVLHNYSKSSKYVKEINGEGLYSPLYNHKARFNNDRDIEIFTLLKPGDDSRASSIEHIMPYTSRSNIFHDKYFKLRPNKVSRTITAHMRYDCNSYIHPTQPRGLTAREAARIQGFPDHYAFGGTFQRLYQQIGNAVPTLLAEALAKSIATILP
jgi:DNA (cytosine-5)-methyltransferase 1